MDRKVNDRKVYDRNSNLKKNLFHFLFVMLYPFETLSIMVLHRYIFFVICKLLWILVVFRGPFWNHSNNSPKVTHSSIQGYKATSTRLFKKKTDGKKNRLMLFQRKCWTRQTMSEFELGSLIPFSTSIIVTLTLCLRTVAGMISEIKIVYLSLWKRKSTEEFY